jgi:hypothetical protein
MSAGVEGALASKEPRGSGSVRAKVALLLSLALTAIVGSLLLTRPPLRVVRVGAKPERALGSTTGTPAVCQADETLPAGVTAIRVGLEASFGPRVLVRAYSGPRIVTAGSRGPNWTSSSVTVPVHPLEHAVSHVKVCFSVPANSGFLQLYGARAVGRQAAVGREGQPLPGRMSLEYMAPGGGSWWSRALSVARHMGVGHAIGGTWVALLVATLVAAVIALVTALAWRELS